MLKFGIDVMILVTFGMFLVVMSHIVCYLMQVTEDVGRAVVRTTGIVSSLMVLAYVIMIKLLEMML